jgi:hypothetical protein
MWLCSLFIDCCKYQQLQPTPRHKAIQALEQQLTCNYPKLWLSRRPLCGHCACGMDELDHVYSTHDEQACTYIVPALRQAHAQYMWPMPWLGHRWIDRERQGGMYIEWDASYIVHTCMHTSHSHPRAACIRHARTRGVVMLPCTRTLSHTCTHNIRTHTY